MFCVKFKSLHLLLFAFVLFSCSCRKDKLTGDHIILKGTWSSFPRYNCGFAGGMYDQKLKLELQEKGKYILYENGKKVEDGRLQNKDGYVTFVCNENKSKLNKKQILKFNSDTLNIDYGCGGGYLHVLVKN